MEANRLRPDRDDGRPGEPPGRDRVISLAEWRAPLAPGGRAAAARHEAAAAIHRLGQQFTSDDRATLAAWTLDIRHGYDRLHVERGVLEDGSWTSYALVYAPGQPWSTWGFMRCDDHVQVWRCATGQTTGRHARMAEALASLPDASDHRRAVPTCLSSAGLRR